MKTLHSGVCHLSWITSQRTVVGKALSGLPELRVTSTVTLRNATEGVPTEVKLSFCCFLTDQ